MSRPDSDQWDWRYESGDYQPRRHPSPLVEEAAGHLKGGRALVLACGTGRNALFLAAQGFEVEAVDISRVAIEMAENEASFRGLNVSWRVGDIEDLEYAEAKYQLITMVRYLNRDVWASIGYALAVDGWLVMEQHLKTRREVAGPPADSRVSPGELIAAFGDLRVIKYLEEYTSSEKTGRRYAMASMLACKGDPGW